MLKKIEEKSEMTKGIEKMLNQRGNLNIPDGQSVSQYVKQKINHRGETKKETQEKIEHRQDKLRQTN